MGTEFRIEKVKVVEGMKGSKGRALLNGYSTTTSIRTCWVVPDSRLKRQCCKDEEETDDRGMDSYNCRTDRRNSTVSPSVRQRFLPSHVFRESSLIFLIIISIFSNYLIRPGNGLHPPQCQWTLYQDIERLNCLVETGNSLIVEEEVHGIGPEHAKSLWVQCSGSDISPSTSSGNSANINNGRSADSDYYSPSASALGTEGVQHQLSSASSTTNNNANSGGGFVLSHGVFMAVPNLRDLRLENCKISGITPGALSYLPYLQNLTVRAHTSLFWPSSASLEIKTGVLRGLPELRHLDLSTTSLSSLPNDFLCFLPSLQSLNLTSCWLRDFRSIGIVPNDPTNPHNCGNQIRVLDMSRNQFTLLPPATFTAVNKLEELRVESNSITIAAERALLGLTQLKVISLAGNRLSSLPPEFFKDNRHLQEIYLQNNSLSVLAPGIFADLKHLVVLDISSNELTSEWINGESGIFRGLSNLYSLSLQNNLISKIDSALFSDLRFLQILNLAENEIKFIADDAFSGLPNLYTLVLSQNKLKVINSFICNGLHGLSFLSVNQNNLQEVADDSFKDCKGLQDLNLSGGELRLSPEALSGLTNLRTLDLGENKIETIANASYQSLPNLYGLRLTGNAITNLPNGSFVSMPALKIINLAKNNISSAEAGVFDNNPNLQAVRLDANKLTDISGLFKNINNLLWLNISSNELEQLKYEDFPPRLQWLDMAQNRIHTLHSCLELENSLRIRNLDLSDNYITEVGSSNLPDSIENLIMGRNRISQIQPYTFYRKTNLTFADFSHNNLVRLDQNALRLGPDRASSASPPAGILLGNNPWQCDCSMEWLQNMNSDETTGQYPVIQDASDVKCTMSFDRLYEPINYLNIHSNQFLCKYESHCFKTCQCCEYELEYCDCHYICPNNCSCYNDQSWNTNVVDCSMLEQSFIPGRIPMEVTELYLDGNIFNQLDSHAFIGRKNLKKLYINSSHVEGIQNRTFWGLKALKTLHLENNFIERLEGFEFEDLENLEELYLQQNSISWIHNETFTSLHRLRVLWLHGNNLVDFAIWQVTTRIGRLGYTLQDITLRGNEFSCECQFATQLKDWLLENRAKISDASQVHCVDQVSTSSTSSLAISGKGGNSQMNSAAVINGHNQNRSQTELVVVRLLDQKNHRCTSSSSSSSQSTDLTALEPTKKADPNADFSLAEYVPWILLFTAMILILILAFVSYHWRQSLRIFLHSHCHIRLNCREPPGERDKLFDAFISYSSKDEAWVRQVLAAELERNDPHPPYRLCLRYRDLPSGGAYLGDTIVQAADASRRVVLILSHHFLKGEWSRTDVKSAHHSVLKDRHRKVIIILLGDLPSKDLDPDIRLYLKNHTYLNCDDKKFWEKLRYALPDVKVKVPVFRGIPGRTNSGRNNSTQHRSASGPPLQPQHQHAPSPPHHVNPAHHHHYNQPSPNLSQAHHLTHLGPNTQNNITSPLIGPPPPPLTAPPVPGLLANLPPNIPNGTLGHPGLNYHPHYQHTTTLGHNGGISGPMTTVLGNVIGGSTASISNSSNGSQRAPQRHPIVNSANNRQNTAIHI